MKFLLSNNKMFLFFLFLSTIYISYSLTALNQKFLLGKQIIEKDENTDIFLTHNSPFMHNSRSKIYRYLDKIDKKENTSLFYKLTRLLGLYFQFFLIICLISFYKWYEEMLKIKSSYIENKYSLFRDLTQVENKENLPVDYDGCYVFDSGVTSLIEPARDPIYDFIENIYAMIERKVEYLDVNDNKWYRLGYIINREDTTDEVIEVNMPDVNILNDNLMELKFNDEVFSYPNIISDIFFGRISLHKVELNSQQIKKLVKYEKIKLPQQLKVNFHKENNIENDEEFIYISPIKSENDLSRIRISFRGFKCENVSVMAKIKDCQFKTIHIPYEYKDDDKTEDTNLINQSTNMIINPNLNFDICNFLFCFCFSGPATYVNTYESNKSDTYISSINWILENESTKMDMINEKHQLRKLNIFLTRIVFLVIIAFTLFALPDALIQTLGALGFDSNFIKKHKFESALLLAKVIITSIYLFTFASYKVKHIFNMIILSVLLVVLVLVIISYSLNLF